jgi:hypothetical protein
LERAVPKLRAKTKLNMQPGDGAEYEAEARAYCDSLRQPFEETLRATKTDYRKWVRKLFWLIVVLFSCAATLSNQTIANFLLRQSTFVFGGKSYKIADIAQSLLPGGVVALMILYPAYGILVTWRLAKANKPLSPRVMVFALCYAIFRELESGERSSVSHHHQRAVSFWAKLLTYLRWSLHGDIAPETAHFGEIPKSDFRLASQAQQFAVALNWSTVAKPEYSVVSALDNLHAKLSPRIKNSQDLPLVKEIVRGIGNFFYTTIIKPHHDDEATWGYGELLRVCEIVNRMDAPAKPEQRPPLISSKLFVHENPILVFFAWWIVVQILIGALVAAAFRLFPSLTMNSQALVALIGGPIAAAISIVVGISRKRS